MHRTTRLAALLAVLAPAAALAQPRPYVVDKSHSEINFVAETRITSTTGYWSAWDAQIAIDPDAPEKSTATITIDAATINTRNERRDNHLKSPDFFAADSFPTITFRSTNVAVNGKQIRVGGDLTIRGRTKPVVLVGTYQGLFKDPWGKMRTAFIASTTINRQDFGVSFNGPFETIGQIGDEVTIEIAIEAVQQ